MACGLPIVAFDDPRYAEYELDRPLISLEAGGSRDQVHAAIREFWAIRIMRGRMSIRQGSWQKPGSIGITQSRAISP